jgi:hypothetical protein
MARQVPRSDASIYACWSIWNYYGSLGLRDDEDRLLGTGQDFDSLPHLAKRRIAQLDNVCSCYRIDILRDHGFSSLRHAEDLELGIRLLKAGFSLGFKASAGFVHSHSRSPAHIFKRSYMDTRSVTTMLGWPRAEGGSSVAQILAAIARLQDGLAKAIHAVRSQRAPGMAETVALVRDALARDLEETEGAAGVPTSDSELGVLLSTLLTAIHGTDQGDDVVRPGWALRRFLSALDALQRFLSSTGALNKDFGEEVFGATYDLLADVGGSLVAESLSATRSDGEASLVTGSFDALLASGI